MLFHSGLFEKSRTNAIKHYIDFHPKVWKYPLRSQWCQAGQKDILPVWPCGGLPSTMSQCLPGPTLHSWSTPCPVIPASQCLSMIRVCIALWFWATQFLGWIYNLLFGNCCKVVLCAKWRPNVNKIYILVRREKMWGTNLVCVLSSRVETPPHGLFGKGNYLFSFLKRETV